MLCRAQYCHDKSCVWPFVCPSVCNTETRHYGDIGWIWNTSKIIPRNIPNLGGIVVRYWKSDSSDFRAQYMPISETAEDTAKVTINCLCKVIDKESIGAKMHDLEWPLNDNTFCHPFIQMVNYVAAKATYIRLLHGKMGFFGGFFGPSSVKWGRTHIVLGWNM